MTAHNSSGLRPPQLRTSAHETGLSLRPPAHETGLLRALQPTAPPSHTDPSLLGASARQAKRPPGAFLFPNSEAERTGVLKALFAPQVGGDRRVRKRSVDITMKVCYRHLGVLRWAVRGISPRETRLLAHNEQRAPRQPSKSLL